MIKLEKAISEWKTVAKNAGQAPTRGIIRELNDEVEAGGVPVKTSEQ